MKEYVLEHGGYTFKIVDRHTGNKIPVLIIHGNSSGNAASELIIDDSTLKQHRVICIGLPGHNGLSIRDKPISLPALGSAIEGVIHKLVDKNYIAIGHSLGGHIISHCANKLSSCLGLILISAPPINIKFMEIAFISDERNNLVFTRQLDDAQINILANQFLDKTSQHIALVKDQINITDGFFRERLAESLANGLLNDEVSTLEQSDMYKVLVIGDDDKFISKEFCDHIMENTTSINEVVQVSNSGHCPHLSSTQSFQSLIKDLIGKMEVAC